jgi:hypothetical protein
MPHQNWAEPFNDDATRACDRHQCSLSEALRQFEAAKAKAAKEQRADYIAARDWFDSLKNTPDDPSYQEAKDAYEQSKAPASLSQARKVLAEAIRKADEELKVTLGEGGAEAPGDRQRRGCEQVR